MLSFTIPYIHSLHAYIHRSVALQQAFYGSPPTCPVLCLPIPYIQCCILLP